MKIKVINGPNLNMLGIRNVNIYGKETYDDLINYVKKSCETHMIEVDFIQSNYEGKIIDEIHDVYFNKYDALIINPGAYTHYSYAIRDALEILQCKVVEVHLSDINNREAFRKDDVIRDVCHHFIMGKGFAGYIEALEYILNMDK